MRWRPDIMCAASRARTSRVHRRTMRHATRAISCSGPRTAVAGAAFSARRLESAKCAPLPRAHLRLRTSRTARTSASCRCDYARVVQRLAADAAQPGDIVDMSRRVIGRHSGVIHFHGGTAQGSWHLRRSTPLFVSPSMRRAPGDLRFRATRCACARLPSRKSIGSLRWLMLSIAR